MRSPIFRSNLSPDFSQSIEASYSNSHGPVVREVANLGLASVFATDVTLNGDETKEFEIDVLPGATRVGASVGSREATRSDVDLYLFDCTAGECTLRDFSTWPGASEQVAVDSPAAGKWKVIIDLPNIRNRHSFQYKDYLLHPAYGRLDVQNDRKPVAPGVAVTQPVNVKIGAVPVPPRYLEAILMVVAGVGPNTEAQKRPDALEQYYPGHAILGVTSIKLEPAAARTSRK